MKNPRVFALQLATIFALTFFVNQANAQVQTARIGVSTCSNSNGFYEYLPQGYFTDANQNYPLLIAIHGVGELGNGTTQLSNLLWTGVPAVINYGQFPTSFNVGGQTFKFIVISPQFINWPSAQDIDNVLNYAVSHYRVNTSRVYLTGYSMGGGAVWEYAGGSSIYANRIAAIVPLAGASWPDHGRARTIAAANIAVWAGHNSGDGTVPVSYTNDYVAQINEAPAPTPMAKKTIWDVGVHDCWTYMMNCSVVENGMNMYQWMLQYSKGSAPPPSLNQLPVANAGPDQNLTTTSVQLNGSASDPDGTITSYTWTKVFGPAQGTFSSTTVPNPTVTDLAFGTYTFRLAVTDNVGATAYDDVVVTVNAPLPGRVEAENYAAMSGVQTEATQDAGGGLNVGYQDAGDWMDYNVNAPTAGNYTVAFRLASLSGGGQFQLRNAAGTALATVNIPSTGWWQTWQTVTANVSLPQGAQTLRIYTTNAGGGWNLNWMDFTTGGAVNQLPTVSAGNAQTITLPTNTATLTGSASDADGTIASYAWSQLSGPNTASIASPSSASTTIGNLVQGTYSFRLTATDNAGGSASATVNVVVNAAATPPPSSGSVIHIEAENFSSQSGIQTEPTSDVGGGRNVGAQDQGDWMDYSVNVPSSGLYTVSLRVATLYQTAQVQLKTSSGTILSTIDVPPSGGYQVWKTITATVNLTQGQQTLRLQTTSSPSGWNLNWWELAGGSTTTPTNQPPTVVAGAAQTITLPTSSVTLSGTATDADGTIASYQWSQVSGPAAATIASSTSASTSVTALVQGTYVFKLTATDNGGATGSDQVSVTVNPQATTPPSGGSTIHIEAENYTAMSGIQTENTSDVGGGKNVGYQDAGDWMEYAVNVPSAGSYAVNLRIATLYQTAQVQIKNAAGTVLATIDVIPSGGYQVWKTINATVTLPAGQQTLRLQTTSSPSGWNLNWWELLGGSTTSTNQAPTVNAGTAQTITLPTSAVTLTGTATDSDGTIASYQWSQLSGPNTASIAAAASASTSVSGLVQGSYVFKLTATDNQGASASAQVTITVNGTIVVPASTIHIEAENYSAQSGIQTEPTSDAGGGRNVGAQDAGDWMDYAVNVPATGTYTVSLRVATLYQQAQVQLKTSSGTVLSTINVAPTGGYQLWQTITATVNLTQGQQTLRLQTTQSPSGWNLNWWEITGPSSSAGTVSTQSTELTIDSTLSATSSVKIYPNPVQDNLTVRIDNTLTGKVKVEVLNLQGEVVKQYALNKTSKGVTQYYLSAATLAKGEYILKVTMNNFNQSTKIVKE